MPVTPARLPQSIPSSSNACAYACIRTESAEVAIDPAQYTIRITFHRRSDRSFRTHAHAQSHRRWRCMQSPALHIQTKKGGRCLAHARVLSVLIKLEKGWRQPCLLSCDADEVQRLRSLHGCRNLFMPPSHLVQWQCSLINPDVFNLNILELTTYSKIMISFPSLS